MLRSRIEEELRNAKDKVVDAEKSRIMGKYVEGLGKLHQLYIDSLNEFEAESQEESEEQLKNRRQAIEDHWREVMEAKVQKVVEDLSEQRNQRIDEEEKVRHETIVMGKQLKMQEELLNVLDTHQKFQKYLILLQEDALKGRSLEKDIKELVRHILHIYSIESGLWR